MHNSLARIAPEFAISEPDARELATSFCNWRRHYGSTMDPKTRDLLAFLGVVAMVEGPRVGRAMSRRKAERQAHAAAQAAASSGGGTVVNMDAFDRR